MKKLVAIMCLMPWLALGLYSIVFGNYDLAVKVISAAWIVVSPPITLLVIIGAYYEGQRSKP